MSWWKKLGLKISSYSTYPRFLIKLINKSPTNTTLHIDEKADISPNVSLSGEISLGESVSIAPGNKVSGKVMLSTSVEIRNDNSILSGDIDVGDFTYFSGDNNLYGNINIGRYCAFGPMSSVWERNHNIRLPSQGTRLAARFENGDGHKSEGPVDIGHDVWVGEKATILSGVKVGHGATIGAGAVVASDVEPYAVVGGNPAKRINWRFPKPIREELLELQWWNWSTERIQRNNKFFQTDLTEETTIQELIVA
ncbi:CatB-related O-acetyltransferase [Natrinema salsiterrestre]|uniref:CatB-related O-acetyltransferase n=1 Tax=Natrinema salsiterrestre TaxID=2950540 RepID=A0A9Q4L2V9_9EURY|nr:CatB-related O-acetyltransferase [Natrinema salsiterrestre]MDF9745858.1 CatB-related O-acetyltransferase [Natrinema salsiterrestre]